MSKTICPKCKAEITFWVGLKDKIANRCSKCGHLFFEPWPKTTEGGDKK